MKPQKETREERFRRLAEARVNKLLQLVRLLVILDWAATYAYTREQVEQIFTTLQLALVQTKMRFLQVQKQGKKRFSLGAPYETSVPAEEDHPAFVIPLPDGSYLRAVGFSNTDYPCINIYWDNGINMPTETLCFAEFNPEKSGNQRVCIGTYCADREDTTYYEPYFTAERNQDE